MKKFLIVYHAPVSAMESMENVNPEDKGKEMAKWTEGMENCGSSLVDMGAPAGNGVTLTKEGNTDSKRNVVGYSILQAEDLEGAKKLCENHPHLEYMEGSEIEVHELFQVPGM